MIGKLFRSLLNLLFPKVCVNCAGAIPEALVSYLCPKCLTDLPLIPLTAYTRQSLQSIFWGRCEVEQVYSMLNFEKEGMGQTILHEIKYKNHVELAKYMGGLMGAYFEREWKERGVDMLVPIPLHKRRMKQRGYNQSALIAKGIEAAIGIKCNEIVLERTVSTESQTNKGRWERWHNVKNIFECKSPSLYEGKHILLLDDVLTTGATMEAGIHALYSSIEAVKVSVVSLAWAGWGK